MSNGTLEPNPLQFSKVFLLETVTTIQSSPSPLLVPRMLTISFLFQTIARCVSGILVSSVTQRLTLTCSISNRINRMIKKLSKLTLWSSQKTRLTNSTSDLKTITFTRQTFISQVPLLKLNSRIRHGEPSLVTVLQ